MNLPNRLTILRVLLIPVCILLTLLNLPGWAAATFALAALTDFLDGHIARKRHLVTNFGKFADPVADKILSLCMMIVLVFFAGYPWWAACVVAARELAVDGLRLVAVEQGVVIPAGKLGKVKTNFQFLSVLSSLLRLPDALTLSLCVVMAALTVLSGIEYFRGARHLLSLSPNTTT
ncbi:MAG TPA: CDP-diacylglycerol--glycerol-3-phosphate 3-phosphatidyltransferase [Candidatus Limnocylindria bacterium]|nr:CDP-diacylglycerol--glycerol-3-phosphate 3-phosphatidyltransferase [Candidatus Limnocylindria bacterium]